MAAGSVESIAHYRVLRRIGRGGMGIVYKAVDERDGRNVALKVIREAEAAADDSAVHLREARVRFDREAEILRGLLHVNIVSFYEIGEEDGTPYLAMEFLEGSSIAAFAGRPYTETLPLLIQAANGLEYLASRGIVHRDLSPDNIFVIEGGSGERIVKLLDFGVAKLFEAATGLESLTATGFFLGKVAYGSPEQLGLLGHGAELDWRSDVYSLGVIFFQVLAGQRPFEGKAPVEYIAAHLNSQPPPVAAPPGSPPLPIGLVRLIGQMLEKRREDRPKSWREIVDGLVAALRDAGHPGADRLVLGREGARADTPTGTTSLVGPTTPRSETVITTTSRASLARAAAGVVLLAAIFGFLVWRAFQPAPPRTTPAATPGPRPRVTAARPLVPQLPGALRIHATPYARVVSITDTRTGLQVPLDPGATTPLALAPLPPGLYRVVLTCPALDGKSVEREVTVTPGEPALLAEPFLEPEALLERLR